MGDPYLNDPWTATPSPIDGADMGPESSFDAIERADATTDAPAERVRSESAGGIGGGLAVGGAIAAVLALMGLTARWRRARSDRMTADAVGEPSTAAETPW